MAPTNYAAAGVDTAAEEPALDRLKRWVGTTAQFRPELTALARYENRESGYTLSEFKEMVQNLGSAVKLQESRRLARS